MAYAAGGYIPHEANNRSSFRALLTIVNDEKQPDARSNKNQKLWDPFQSRTGRRICASSAEVETEEMTPSAVTFVGTNRWYLRVGNLTAEKMSSSKWEPDKEGRNFNENE